jgi:hypothetical protein
MDVRIASDHDKENWNQFVDQQGGSFFQYYDWKYIYEYNQYGRFIPLLIEDKNSDITGIFPLVDQRISRIYPSLSSLPEGATGGFLLSKSLDNDQKNKHLKLFFEFIDKNYSNTHSLLTIKEHLQYDEGPDGPSKVLVENGYQWLDNSSTNLPCTHILKLDPQFEDKVWNGLFSKRLRKSIRHVKKTGIRVVIDDKFEYLDEYINMQHQTVKKFGLVVEKEDIAQIVNVFQNKIKLFIGILDSQPISASFCFFTPTTFYLSKGPYLPVASEYLTNTLPNCAAIKYACEHGFRYLEFGVTQSENLAYHKEKWGSTRIPMRIYTKKFSNFKVFTNKTYGYIRWGKKKLIGS